jgi:hypothetical protein
MSPSLKLPTVGLYSESGKFNLDPHTTVLRVLILFYLSLILFFPKTEEKCQTVPCVSRSHFTLQWNLELRTQSVPGDGSTFKLFDFRVKFPH